MPDAVTLLDEAVLLENGKDRLAGGDGKRRVEGARGGEDSVAVDVSMCAAAISEEGEAKSDSSMPARSAMAQEPDVVT